jgi:hypothetical protein
MKAFLLSGLSASAVILGVSVPQASAGELPAAPAPGCAVDLSAPCPACPADLFTVQILGGAYIKSGAGAHVAPFDYAPIDLRLGWMPNTPWGDGTCLRGYWEGILDLMGAPVWTHYGNVVTGASLLLRYNYVQPDCRLVPYIQAGGGLVYSDAYRSHDQRTIGQAVEFLLPAAVGCRYILNPHWTLDAEAGFQHISNANLAGRNAGTNDVGVSLGLTYYFPCGSR